MCQLIPVHMSGSAAWRQLTRPTAALYFASALLQTSGSSTSPQCSAHLHSWKEVNMVSISRPLDEEQADEGVLLFVLLFWKEIHIICVFKLN